MQQYATNRGWERVDPAEWDFFRALNCYRRVGINHGVYARSVMGTAASSAVRQAGGTLQPNVELGLKFASGEYVSAHNSSGRSGSHTPDPGRENDQGEQIGDGALQLSRVVRWRS